MGEQHVYAARASRDPQPVKADLAPFERSAGQAHTAASRRADPGAPDPRRAAALGHRFAPGGAGGAPIQRWPLSRVAGWLGLGADKDEEAPADVRPGKYRYRADHGETHKPLKTKDKHERITRPLIEGSAPSPKPDTIKGEKPYFKTSPKKNWGDFSVKGVKRERYRQGPQKKQGKVTYDVKGLHGSYDRAPLAGYGIDNSYTVGPRENLSGSLLNASAKAEHELVKNAVKLSGKGSLQLGSAEAGLEGGLRGTYEDEEGTKPRLDARASGKLGGYLGQASGDLTGGFRVPWTNIMLSGGVTGKAAVGLGVSGEAALKASREEGLRATLSGSLVSGLGFGGGLMVNVGKYDSKRGWLDTGSNDGPPQNQPRPQQRKKKGGKKKGGKKKGGKKRR